MSTHNIGAIERVTSHPYWRLSRLDFLSGGMVTAWPGLWGAALGLAARRFEGETDASLPADHPLGSNIMLLFLVLIIWGIEMHSVGCVVNDMMDRDIDAKVKRTKKRPLASGEVTLAEAWLLLAAHCVVWLGMTYYLFASLTSVHLVLIQIPIICLYPMMKRWTPFPQFWLGLAINGGVHVGFTEAYGTLIPEITIPLHAALACWTVVYDTIYAHCDTDDDAKLNLGSTALLFGKKNSKMILSGFAIIMAALLLVTQHRLALAVGDESPLGWPYNTSVGLSLVYLLWQVRTAKLGDPKDLIAKFNMNSYAVGGTIFIGMYLGGTIG